MDTIQFTTVIGDDGLIHPPKGIDLPSGDVEVLLRRVGMAVESDAPSLQWLIDLAEEAERDGPDLPEDMAENHDFYAHGKPKS